MRKPDQAVRCGLIAGILSLVTSYVASAECSKILTIGFPNFETTAIKGAHIDPVLVDVAILKKAMALANCAYTLESYPWKRTINAVKHGTIDGALDVSKTKERSEFGRFSISYRQEKSGIVMRRADIKRFNPRSFQDIVNSGLRIGTNLGYWYGEDFDKAYKENAAFRERVLSTSIDMTMHAWLGKKRVDMFFMDRDAARHIIAAYDHQDTIALHPYILNTDSLHIFLSKETTLQRDIDAINKGLAQLMGSETYHTLMRIFSQKVHSEADRAILWEILNDKRNR